MIQMLILLCGRSGVGKTSLCRVMEQEGFYVISASGVARQMYEDEYGPSPDRRELVQYGELILKTARERTFTRRLEAVVREAFSSQNVLVDGLRSPMAVRRMKRRLNATLVFVKRSSHPKDRLEDLSLEGALEKIDAKLDCIEYLCDGCIENDSSVRDMQSALLKIVGARR